MISFLARRKKRRKVLEVHLLDNDDEGVKGGEETKTSKGTETENKTKESKEEEGESSSKRKRYVNYQAFFLTLIGFFFSTKM